MLCGIDIIQLNICRYSHIKIECEMFRVRVYVGNKQPNLSNVTLLHVTPSLITHNHMEQMLSSSMSLLVVTFVVIYHGFDIELSTKWF